jgi:hypothetical protein
VVVESSYVHVKVRVTRREDAAVAARVETDDLDGFLHYLKVDFGFFMNLGTVGFVTLIA